MLARMRRCKQRPGPNALRSLLSGPSPTSYKVVIRSGDTAPLSYVSNGSYAQKCDQSHQDLENQDRHLPISNTYIGCVFAHPIG
jgi:hypothetical protein